jgi:hypothetical protein
MGETPKERAEHYRRLADMAHQPEVRDKILDEARMLERQAEENAAEQKPVRRRRCAAITDNGTPCQLEGSYRLGELLYCVRHVAVARDRAEVAGRKRH